MRILQILILLTSLAFTSHAQTITETPTMIGVSVTTIPTHVFNGNVVEADSIVFESSCDPYQSALTSQEIGFNDTLWFPKEHYLRGYVRAFWTDHSFTCPVGSVVHEGENTPRIEVQMPGFGTNQNLSLVSNAKTVRVMILHPIYGMIYYKNFTGIEGQNNQHFINKQLQPGAYTMVVRGMYSDDYLCHPQTTIVFPFVVIQ